MRTIGSYRSIALAGLIAAVTFTPARVTSSSVAQFETTPTIFSGQATAVKGTVLGVPITLVDTGTIAPEGGTVHQRLLCYPNGGGCTLGLPDLTNGQLSASVLHASVVAQGHQSRARASVAELSLTNVAGNNISAAFLQAEATARCSGGQASVEASSELAELVINGESIASTGETNQTITLPAGGVVIINEQVGSVSGGVGDTTVTALHIKIPGPLPGTDTDLIVAQAHADIQCGRSFCPAERDFVTGGGWIADATRRNFAVAGGIKNGDYWGHLLYIDHTRPEPLKVKGTAVTLYQVTGPTTRHIEGTCLINGAAGTYIVDLEDLNEPGKGADSFALTLSNGYTAFGKLAGGNLQIHTCK